MKEKIRLSCRHYSMPLIINSLLRNHQIMHGQVQDRHQRDGDDQTYKANDESDRLRRLEEWQNVKV